MSLIISCLTGSRSLYNSVFILEKGRFWVVNFLQASLLKSWKGGCPGKMEYTSDA